jgi:UDP-N-acetylmuramate: L-alanyl-gamma-D-glutamyl-meso-diaminopimelate ligase
VHVHILGICGTFMAGIAAIAREAGHRVTGSDTSAWPPMSTQLAALGIDVMSGYDPKHLEPAPDVVIVGNVITRGNAAVEAMLDRGLPYISGPQWLAENVLRGRHVLAVAGTHGKTTASSILAWLLEHAGLAPGFLIGGVPQNFGVSARLGTGKHFVVEADEYDTAFFDKRSKFVHYGPRTVILNNLEYDHADIFPDLTSIERQFHHLVRTVPRAGRLIVNGRDEALARVLKMGCWSEVQRFDVDDGWQAVPSPPARGERARERGPQIEVLYQGNPLAHGPCPLTGDFNRSNALAAIAAAAHVGVSVETALQGLAEFRNVRRRLELVGSARGIEVYDDFAHHPTAIRVTIDALLQRNKGRVLAVLEPRSNTMRMGVHTAELTESLRHADLCFVFAPPELKWDAGAALAPLGARVRVVQRLDQLVQDITRASRPTDRILVMSNGDFGGVHGKILNALSAQALETS